LKVDLLVIEPLAVVRTAIVLSKMA
jgi:hypothetical protein